MSDLKLINGRIGKDRLLGNYTCHTSKGKSTVDYAIGSMEIFPYITDFHVDILDKCMSDVHCPVCLVMSTYNNSIPCKQFDTTNAEINELYMRKNTVVTKWNNDHSDHYAHLFNMEDVNNLQNSLSEIMTNMSLATQSTIDTLYENITSVFIKPAKETGMYKEIKPRKFVKKSRRHGRNVWFNNECEILRKKYMCLKDSLNMGNVTLEQHQEFETHFKTYKKCVTKSKRSYTKEFHSEIRNLKTRNPKEFWKIINTNTKLNSKDNSTIVFAQFIDHFKELNSAPLLPGVAQPLPNIGDTPHNDAINEPFTLCEIKHAIKKMKNNKSCGADNMINEYFKHCQPECLHIIVDFFNIVLDTGYIPNEWCLGIIHPIYKNKGSVSDPDNYRGITLLSCTSKLFTACINKRLSIYVEDQILGEEQAGFRGGYSTIDHTFVLQLVIELYQSVHKRVYCAFIDYRKAFDSIDRTLLWKKLLLYGINGKVFDVIRNLYKNAKSCIKKDNLLSDYFLCNIGVRQGDNLSPLLFALFINDFTQHISNSFHGLNIAGTCYPSLIHDNIVLLKLFVLLYADDTIILAENEHELQCALSAVHEYCEVNKLSVNTSKTKIIVFSRGKIRKIPSFRYGADIIEVVSDYIYLGVTMHYNNKFATAIKKQVDQARKAQFSMLVKARKLVLPIDIQCNLFDKLVTPILTYGCEVWGIQSVEMVELFYRKFLKKLLKLRPSTPTCMVYGEVGKLPMQVIIDKQIINFWLRLLNKDEATLAHIVYIIAFTLFKKDEYKAHWLVRVKSILDNCGLSYLWHNQQVIDTKESKKIIHKQIEDLALQSWYANISASSMCAMYRLFKRQLTFDNYLLNPCHRDRISLTRFRCSNSKLPVYNQIYKYDTNKCTLCNLDTIGDEYHYIMICTFFTQTRKKCVKPYYYTHPNVWKFEQLFTSSNRKVQDNLAKFTTCILIHFQAG